jgi:hypothetical protein
MKPNAITLGLLAVFATPVLADVTVDITGATAFRQATLKAIKAKYLTGASFKFGHDQTTTGGTAYTGSTRSIWIGTFPGVTGNTTIRTHFTGSVEGIRALVGVALPAEHTYYNVSVLDSANATATGEEVGSLGSSNTANDPAEIAFSDVSKASTPYSSYTLQPASPACGVVVFTMLTNEGSPITNVTSQQFRGLMTQGYLPLSMFTGNASDTAPVLATGRNDGSGTRTTYLAETGYGITKTVKQYVAVDGNGTHIEALQEVPQGGKNNPLTGDLATYNGTYGPITQSVSNASTVWAQDVAGNGGYNSGGTLRSDMGKLANAVRIFTASGSYALGTSAATTKQAYLVTWLSVGDAKTARNAGGIVCGFNGVRLDAFGNQSYTGDLTDATDIAKVTEGAYTAWGFQQMYCRNDAYSGNVKKVYDEIKAAIPAEISTAGIALTAMHVGRPSDGGTVTPISEE